MKNKLIRAIVYDLADNEELVEFVRSKPAENMFLCHFGAGMYIRNKYLWNSPENCRLLSEYYNTDDIDELSSKLLGELSLYINATVTKKHKK